MAMKVDLFILDYVSTTDFHKAGLLCGNCQDGYSPFVLSYNLSCVSILTVIETGESSSLLGLGHSRFSIFCGSL